MALCICAKIKGTTCVLLIAFVIVPILVFYQWLKMNYSATLDDSELNNQNIIITGSSSGIGESMAYQCCKAHANVIITGRNKTRLQNVENRCRQLGAKSVHSIQISLDSLDNCNKFVDKALSILGEIGTNNKQKSKIQLDYLVLNHASVPYLRPYMNESQIYNRKAIDKLLDNVEFLFNVNTLSIINIATLLISNLEQSNGRIIISNSVAGRTSLPWSVVYVSNKFALNGFFESWRKELVMRHNPKSNVSITMCTIGLIGTEVGLRVTNDINMPIGFQVGVVEDTARDILGGGQKRLQSVFTPFHIVSYSIGMINYFTAFNDAMINYLYYGSIA